LIFWNFHEKNKYKKIPILFQLISKHCVSRVTDTVVTEVTDTVGMAFFAIVAIGICATPPGGPAGPGGAPLAAVTDVTISLLMASFAWGVALAIFRTTPSGCLG